METPKMWHFSADPRIGDIVVIANGPSMIGTKPPAAVDPVTAWRSE
jgi:hypothetical protein